MMFLTTKRRLRSGMLSSTLEEGSKVILNQFKMFPLKKTTTKRRMIEVSNVKVKIIRVSKMKTAPMNNTLLQMTSTSC